MWISDQEAQDRLNRSTNILSRVSRDESKPACYPVSVPDFPPSDPDDSEPTPAETSAPAVDLSPIDYDPSAPNDSLEALPDEAEDAESPAVPDCEVLVEGEEGTGDVGSEEPSDDVVRALIRTARNQKKVGHLTKPEAADAAIVGQLTSPNYAGRLFGKTNDHITHLNRNGNQSRAVGVKPNEVRELIERQRTKIRDAAFDRLETVLSCLDADKIKSVTKPRELANIAAQLTVVADKMLPKEMQTGEDTVHFHIMRPPVAIEADYDVVEVG